jgi:hypothetical protein
MSKSRYVPRGSDLADIHKLYTSVFKPMNIFSVMNIDPEENKKLMNECLFPVVCGQGGAAF